MIFSRDDARAAGEKRYFDGVPCKHGHVAERYVRDPRCTACTDARNAEPPEAKLAATQRAAQKRADLASRRLSDPRICTRKDAKAQGRITYFLGTPCKIGHVTERYVSSGSCTQCNHERFIQIQSDPDLRAARNTRTAAHNQTETSKTAKKRWYEANPEKVIAKNHTRRARIKGAGGSYTPG
jgi:hypothetical protein